MYHVVIHGFDAKVEIESFTPPVAPVTHLLPEDCDLGDPGELAWKASTGNELLDYYIDNDELIIDEVEEQLFNLLLDAREEAGIQAYEDAKHEY